MGFLERLPPSVRELGLVTLGYSLLTVVLTYPGILYWNTRLLCDGFDCYQNIWNMWWLKTALLDLQTNPYYTTYLHYPEGVTLVFQTFNPFNGLISIPLQAALSMHLVYNLIVLFSFVASGVGMYYLARHLVGSRPAAFIAGMIYTFSPFHFAHGLGHLQLIAMEWLPVYILFIIKTLDEGGYRNGALAGFFLILTSLCSWYYLIYGLLLSALLFLVRARELWSDRLRLTAIGVAMAVYLVPMSPLLGSMLHAGLTQEFAGAHDPVEWSADLTSFFVPNAVSTYAEYTSPIWSRWTGNEAENANYLGYIVLGLAVAALVRLRASRFWGWTALVFATLALGPYPHFLGQLYEIPLPYWVLHRFVPLFDLSGVPTRFTIMVILCLAILVGYFLADWLRNGRASTRVKSAAIAAVAIGIAAEYLAVPFRTVESLDVPPFYRETAQDPEQYGIMDIPSRPLTLYFATIHGKPVVGGYVSRPSVSALQYLENTPIISTLMTGRPLPSAPDVGALARAVFREANIRYIVSHDGAHADLLSNVLGFPVVDTRGGIQVYDTR